MTLTNEQLEQCRREFEKMYSKSPWVLEDDGNGSYKKDSHHFAWQGFKAAWRPVPTVEDMLKIMWDIKVGWRSNRISLELIGKFAQAIHRAFVGKDE